MVVVSVANILLRRVELRGSVAAAKLLQPTMFLSLEIPNWLLLKRKPGTRRLPKGQRRRRITPESLLSDLHIQRTARASMALIWRRGRRASGLGTQPRKSCGARLL